jgi:hypothetical protein
VFGWIKTTGGVAQVKVRGLPKVQAVFAFAILATISSGYPSFWRPHHDQARSTTVSLESSKLRLSRAKTKCAFFSSLLGSPRPTLSRASSVSCSLLNQQASHLEQELEVDDGFHRTPLVPGSLKTLQ